MINIEDRQMLLNDLKMLIGKSAKLMNNLSHKECIGSHINESSCSWYHGAWQYLRACDKVSSPTWHLDFYIDSLTSFLKPNYKVLISGTADYSTLSIVLFVAKKLNLELSIDIVDLCRTPLLICEWYAEQVGANIRTINQSVFDLSQREYYDIIITDAFLTRFSPINRSNVLVQWSSLINNSGRIITTIRTCEVLEDNIVMIPQNQTEEYVNEVFGIYNRLGFKEGISDIESIAKKYIENIKSYPYEDIEGVYQDFNSNGLGIIQCSDSILKGEAKPSKYLRIIAAKSHSTV